MLLSADGSPYGREARRLLPEIGDGEPLVSSETAARYLNASVEEMENLASNSCLRFVVRDGEEMVYLRDVLNSEKLEKL